MAKDQKTGPESKHLQAIKVIKKSCRATSNWFVLPAVEVIKLFINYLLFLKVDYNTICSSNMYILSGVFKLTVRYCLTNNEVFSFSVEEKPELMSQTLDEI